MDRVVRDGLFLLQSMPGQLEKGRVQRAMRDRGADLRECPPAAPELDTERTPGGMKREAGLLLRVSTSQICWESPRRSRVERIAVTVFEGSMATR